MLVILSALFKDLNILFNSAKVFDPLFGFLKLSLNLLKFSLSLLNLFLEIIVLFNEFFN